MRLLHVDTGRQWRGGQRQCALLCEQLARDGYPVGVACPPEAPLARALAGGPVDVHPLPLRGEVDPRALLGLKRLVRRLQPDLLAAHDARAHGLLAYARRAMGSPVPLVYHRRIDLPLRGGPLRRWKRRQTARYVAVSRAAVRALEASGVASAEIRLVYSGIPDAVPHPGARTELRAALGLSDGAVLIGTVGGLIRHKGHAVLLEAFARLRQDRGDLHLALVGDGPLRRELCARAERAGCAAQVHFLGERRDVGPLLDGLDLFVLPSLTEGLGSSILDAFARRLPVVASQAGGIPELVVPGETGRLTRPGDVTDLARTLRVALDEPAASAAMAADARARFLERFTDRVMTSATLRCYEELHATEPSS